MTDGQLADEVGSRIRFHRLANGQTQEVVAGLAGITVDYLYQIERGRKLPALPVLVALARVLHTDPGALLGHADDGDAQAPAEATVDLPRVMFTEPAAGVPIPIGDLRAQVDQAWDIWQTSPTRYTQMQTIVGDLVVEVERARRHAAAADEIIAANRAAADMYGLVRTIAKRTGYPDLMTVAADRSLRAAEAADDPIRVGAALWNIAHALLARGHPQLAEDTAASAVGKVATLRSSDAAAVRGSLLQVASMGAALADRPGRARVRLHDAESIARATGERNTLWTVFGPTNVAMHAVSVEIEAGNMAQADTVAGGVEWERSASIERRIAFLLDQADGRVRRRDYGGALILLQQGGRTAPEDLSRRPMARRLLGTVMRRAHRSTSREAIALADRYAVPVA